MEKVDIYMLVKVSISIWHKPEKQKTKERLRWLWTFGSWKFCWWLPIFPFPLQETWAEQLIYQLFLVHFLNRFWSPEPVRSAGRTFPCTKQYCAPIKRSNFSLPRPFACLFQLVFPKNQAITKRFHSFQHVSILNLSKNDKKNNIHYFKSKHNLTSNKNLFL